MIFIIKSPLIENDQENVQGTLNISHIEPHFMMFLANYGKISKFNVSGTYAVKGANDLVVFIAGLIECMQFLSFTYS